MADLDYDLLTEAGTKLDRLERDACADAAHVLRLAAVEMRYEVKMQVLELADALQTLSAPITIHFGPDGHP